MVEESSGSVPALEQIRRAASIVEVMYRSLGPNTGSNPGARQIQKNENRLYSRQDSNIEWKSSNNTNLNIIEILNKLFNKIYLIFYYLFEYFDDIK